MLKFLQIIPLILLLNACNNAQNRQIILSEWQPEAPIAPAPKKIINNEVKQPIYQQYIVQKGENLYDIAKAKNVSIESLITINNLKPPYELREAMVLNYQAALIYIVEKGDSLSQIAKKFNTSLNSIIQANNIQAPFGVKADSKLIIPNAVVANPKLIAVSESTSTIAPAPPPVVVSTIQEPAVVPNAPLAPDLSIKSPIQPYLSNNSPKPPINNPIKSPVKPYSEPLNIPPRAGQFVWPVKGSIIQNFGNYAEGLWNDGINIRAKLGTNILSVENGEVAYTGEEIKGFGKLILIRHTDGFVSTYAHCDKILVKVGDKVKINQVIGEVGQTGLVSESQLHFEIRKNNTPVDPLTYLGSAPNG